MLNTIKYTVVTIIINQFTNKRIYIPVSANVKATQGYQHVIIICHLRRVIVYKNPR